MFTKMKEEENLIQQNMGSSWFDLIIFFLCAFLINFSITTATAQSLPPTYLYHFCQGANYTANSTYESNLKLLLTSLSSNNNRNSINTNGFYNSTVGRSPDTVYGSLQCRGDVDSPGCRACVNTATQDVRKEDRCPISKQAVIFYDECTLRYSDRFFFSFMADSPAVYLSNTDNISNPDRFNQILGGLLSDLRTDAVAPSSNNTWFATGERNITNIEKVYGLVQCTSDLSPSICDVCLQRAIAKLSECCDGKKGGSIITPSCNFRYEIYPFFQARVNAISTSGTVSSWFKRAGKRKSSTKIVMFITIPVVIVVFISAIMIWFMCFRRKKIPKKFVDVDEIQTAESLQFHLSTVRDATDNFSDANKLGQGGFGSVYKGVLPGGEEIAVKRLSRSSGQGEEEFKNEVILLAKLKLQHRNLVRLLGFCLDGEERLLIYEFLPNGSLDQLLLDPVRRTSFDWKTRYKIICGIARGLLYVHQDSLHRIIHRDLKASNVLLSADMNPQISDFGMARLFVVDQTQGNTNRVVGTFGYMSPEYAMHGQFSVKADVFSYGVLVLEIITGRRINTFYESERDEYLLSHSWGYWKEGKALELLDPCLRGHCSRHEVTKCIQIGLLCVQEVADRPTMELIAQMLSSSRVTVPLPSTGPATFVQGRNDPNLLLSEDRGTVEILSGTVDDASITELQPRP